MSRLIMFPQSRIYDYFTRSILTLIPQHKFIIVSCFTIMQIHKKLMSGSICFKGPNRAKRSQISQS
jgi:hypothetical protein